jgi:hypothetical protein
MRSILTLRNLRRQTSGASNPSFDILPQAATPFQLARAVMTTALPVYDRSVPAAVAASIPAGEIPATPLRLGGGGINLPALLTSRVDVNPAKIELGSNVTWGNSFVATLDVAMIGSMSAGLVYSLTHVPASAINDAQLLVINKTVSGPFNNRSALPYDPSYSPVTASISFSSSRITNISSFTVPINGNFRLRVRLPIPP